MLSIENVSKYYGKIKALDGVDIEIQNGVYGLLGPNGAGKTTLMRILSTILVADEGKISFQDQNWKKRNEIRKYIGYLPQKFSLYKRLTVQEALQYIAELKQIQGDKKKEIKKALKRVNLEEYENRKIGALSGGMLRRLGIAQAILGTPPIIIVDEPTVGLDPEERNHFRNIIKTLGENSIVVLSTHIVEDIDMICDELAVLNHGKVLYQGKKEKLLQQAEHKVWEGTIQEREWNQVFQSLQVTYQKKNEDEYFVRVLSDTMPFLNGKEVMPTLEEAYLYKMGEQNEK